MEIMETEQEILPDVNQKRCLDIWKSQDCLSSYWSGIQFDNVSEMIDNRNEGNFKRTQPRS